MAATYREFLADLYQEHLEDASFLYLQRRHLLTDDETGWSQLDDFEERLEAHLDALVVGSDFAAHLCQARSVEGDAEDLFVAASVFCRTGAAAALANILKKLDADDTERAVPVTDALKGELPAAWTLDLVSAIAHGDERLLPVLAEVLGYRRIKTDQMLRRVAHNPPRRGLPVLLWSIGRTCGDSAVATVRSHLAADDDVTATAALRTLLRLQDVEAFRCFSSSRPGSMPDPIAVGIGGAGAEAPGLLAALRTPAAGDDLIAGLALLGELSAVYPLLDLLSEEQLAGAAADALHVITGAPLFEDVIVVEKMSAEELFPEELPAFEGGQQPRRATGEQFGAKVRRLVRDAAVWREWLKAHSGRFRAGRFYRYGAPGTPEVLIDCLLSDNLPKQYRAWIGDELLVRYGIDLPFEADMRVRQQRRVLRDAASAIAAVRQPFEPGRWYVAGRPWGT